MVEELKSLSTCTRRATACILTDKHDRIIGHGYNGVPSGREHCINVPCAGATYRSGVGLDKCEAIHAEQNALIVCEQPFNIFTCYTTTFPCIHCMKMLLNTSCLHIYYREPYPHEQAKELWLSAGRELHQV
jgi:dCMP deaminase